MVDAKFLAEVAARGWTYVETPSLEAVAGLNCPPFGLGFSRTVRDQVIGTSGLGVPFQALRYGADGSSDYSRVVLLRLTHPMPPLFVSLPDHPRPGVVGLTIPNSAGLLVVSPVPGFAHAVLEVAQPLFVRWAKRYPISLSIDGDSLVATGAPVALDELDTYVEALDDIAAALNAAPSLGRFTATKPLGLSFYGRPTWVYRARDDSILVGAQVSRAGSGHRGLDVVDIPERGLWFTGLVHAYEVDSGDADSGTVNHRDPVGQMLLPFPFGVLANRWRSYGAPLAFFGADLASYSFSAPDPAFATEVVQATRDFLAGAQLPPFAIDGSRVHIRPRVADPQEYARLAWSFAEWFSLLPESIWQRAGLSANPVPRSLR